MRSFPSPFSGIDRDRILAETVRRLSDSTDRRLTELERLAVQGLTEPPDARVRPVRPPRFRVSVGITIFAGGDFLWRCLASVVAAAGYDQLILVCDGEDVDLAARVEAWAEAAGAECRVHGRTLGYTASANQILLAATGDVVVLLNSDTVVPQGWLDRLVTPFADPRTGLAGPWSNAATVQSIPENPAIAGYAANDLPADVDVEAVNAALTATIAPESPSIPAVNGFCLAVRRDLVRTIGLFDGVAFAEGFGEELDYALRAAAAGFGARVADTLYVHHVKSQSFGATRRQQLSALGKDILLRLHGEAEVTRLLAGLRRWSETAPQRAAAATLLRRLADGTAAPLPALRIGVFQANGRDGFRGVTGVSAPDADAGPFVLAPAVDAAAAFDVLVIRSWRDLARAAALADGQPIVHLARSAAEVEDAIGTPEGRVALQDGRIARHFCLDAATATLLQRHLGIGAAILPAGAPAPEAVPSLVIVHAGSPAGPVDRLAAAITAEPGVATTVIDAGAMTPREIERTIRSADYCLDLRPEQAGWRGALRAFRLGAIPLLLSDDGLGEIVEAEVGDVVLPVSATADDLAAAIVRAMTAGAGTSLGLLARRSRPRLPAAWLNAFAGVATPLLRRAPASRMAATA
ncbi:MAG: glycosyltransferase family 2 protein [Bauldia sp.]|nr:glycosyltransferase family 2 protein [Bauldia sp.]